VGGTTSTTRAKDSDRSDTCAILDNALNDGELSLSLSLYVSSDYGRGSIVFAGDGTPKRLDLPT
jgi:hypothetical protein